MSDDLKLAWAVVNLEGTPTVSRRQLLDAVHFAGRNPSRKEMQKFCATFGKDPVFAFQDLVKLCTSLQQTTLSELLHAFEYLDVNGDGKLSKAELEEVLGKNGEHMTDKEIEDVWREFDRNNDGEIDFKEFGSTMGALMDEIRSTTTRQRLLDQLKIVTLTTPEREPAAKGEARPRLQRRGSIASLAGAAGAGPAGAAGMAGLVGVGSAEALAAAALVPNDIKSWNVERLKGAFQAGESGRVFSEQYAFMLSEPSEVFLSLSLACEGPATDVALFLLKIEEEDVDLVAFSTTQINGDSSVRAHLEAGDYVVVPFSSGCSLQKRKAQPKRTVQLFVPRGDELVLSDKAEAALAEVFARVDLDGSGVLRRREYDLLLLRTDGEACDDETWAYMTDTYANGRDHLTLDAFKAMYNQVLAAIDDKDLFYNNFEALGYNKALQCDEARCFTLSCFSRKKHAVAALMATPFDQARLETAVLRSVINNGKKETITERLYLYTHRDGDGRVSIALQNRTTMAATLMLDLSSSSNTRTNAGSLKVPITVPPRSEMLAVHCMPVDAARPWALKVTLRTGTGSA